MQKNRSPRQLALYAAFLITAIFLLIAILLHFFSNSLQASPSGFILLTLTCFLSTYIVIYLSMRRFIYRRVKLIYKSIHRLKLASNEKINTIDMSQDIIDEVEREVADWADDKNQEIESLRSLANYRRNFLGNISHELKTPLFNIQGYLHTLLEGGLYDEKINHSYLSRAAKNVERLQTIVSGLDAIARLESGQVSLNIEEFDIKTLTLEVLEELEVNASNRNIKLLLKDGADNPFLVKADRESVRHVLVNLVTNALKYGREKEGTIKVAFYDMDSNVLVEVADNGLGIAEEHLDHLFDRFYRVDSGRSRSEGGSGLGLSIVKHIIEAHKQTFNVRSTLDVGSTFGFTLEKVR